MWSAYPKGLYAVRHKVSQINLDTIKKHFLKIEYVIQTDKGKESKKERRENKRKIKDKTKERKKRE